jgi:hypothetical protein
MRDLSVREMSGRVGRNANDGELRQSRGVLALKHNSFVHLDS